mmetsp:Transcript_21329/g.59263  ORF Transcript_21329/g.59263 Transcript_21329/m.59263 type:complete len:238 (-) Transcript_21329:393-1106(-)
MMAGCNCPLRRRHEHRPVAQSSLLARLLDGVGRAAMVWRLQLGLEGGLALSQATGLGILASPETILKLQMGLIMHDDAVRDVTLDGGALAVIHMAHRMACLSRTSRKLAACLPALEEAGVIVTRGLLELLHQVQAGHEADVVLDDLQFRGFFRGGWEDLVDGLVRDVVDNFVLVRWNHRRNAIIEDGQLHGFVCQWDEWGRVCREHDDVVEDDERLFERGWIGWCLLCWIGLCVTVK